MKLKSPVFENNGDIPVRFTGEGQDVSPSLEWSAVPRECREFALICEDPDAPERLGVESPFIHWVIYNISPTATLLPQGIDKKPRLQVPIRADQGINSAGTIGYTGPMPPVGHGVHHYVFRLYALNVELGLPPEATKEELMKAIQGHILDASQIVGRYKRMAIQEIA